jgi:hypothetical protein
LNPVGGKENDKQKKTTNMKQTYQTIDYEWLTRPTGDPFADAVPNILK